jgi:high-affinity K+ transport system ATPase subunit B
MRNKIINEIPISATPEEKQRFIEEEKAHGHRVGHCDDGSLISIKE